MESVFHDVPFQPGLKTVSKSKRVDGATCSTLGLAGDLLMVDLSSVALHKLRVAPSHLTQTEAADYPASREWALRLPTSAGLFETVTKLAWMKQDEISDRNCNEFSNPDRRFCDFDLPGMQQGFRQFHSAKHIRNTFQVVSHRSETDFSTSTGQSASTLYCVRARPQRDAP
jgi:hypothetical protein